MQAKPSRCPFMGGACALWRSDAALLRRYSARDGREPADERPQERDYLVAIDAANPDGLFRRGTLPGPQVIAWPMEPTNEAHPQTVPGSTKVLLVRLDPATLVGGHAGLACGPDGVVAYSAICPHAGCEVSGWIDDQKIPRMPRVTIRGTIPREGERRSSTVLPRAVLAALPLKNRR